MLAKKLKTFFCIISASFVFHTASAGIISLNAKISELPPGTIFTFNFDQKASYKDCIFLIFQKGKRACINNDLPSLGRSFSIIMVTDISHGKQCTFKGVSTDPMVTRIDFNEMECYIAIHRAFFDLRSESTVTLGSLKYNFGSLLTLTLPEGWSWANQ